MNNLYTNWLITHNNPKMSLDEYLTAWEKHSNYVVGQIEAGDEKGTAHIQAYVSLKDRKRLTAMKKLDAHAHFEPVKRDNGASDYCMKEETRLEGPIEKGKKPERRNNKKDWEGWFELAKKGKKDQIPKDVLIRCYNQFCRIEKDNQEIGEREFAKTCLWYHGEPRTGKSRTARKTEPGEEKPYIKLPNKWWDGYRGQKKVVIDDLGPEKGKTLVDHLKLWADPWHDQPGENKGGQVTLEFDTLIVTSNYTPESIATGADLVALKARFEEIEFK